MKPSDLNKKHEQVMKFAEWTMDRIGIQKRPRIELTDDIEVVKKNRAYGATTPDGRIWTYVGNRTPADAMRTLCHEILHAKQFEDGVAHEQMDEKTEQHIEDEANALAGRMMRKYGKKDATIYEGKEGSLIHDVADSLPYAYSIPALDSSNNPYLQYKFGVAIAGARGKRSRDQDGLAPFRDPSAAEYFNDEEVIISFDPHIGEIIDQAMADIGLHGGKRIIGVKGSKEAKDVKKHSPVVGFKGYPR